MLSGDETRPAKKSGQRKGKTEQEAKKAEPRKRKSAQRQDPLPDQLLEAAEAIAAETAETTMAEAVEAIAVEVTSTGYAPVDASPPTGTALVPVASAEADTINYQTIANAYGNYARESLDQTRSFFEKLSGVRSLDKAFALQTEFAKQAYDGFVAESQKIRELHGQLARQRLQRWEGLVARMIKPL